jgi:hypothetical protein
MCPGHGCGTSEERVRHGGKMFFALFTVRTIVGTAIR